MGAVESLMCVMKKIRSKIDVITNSSTEVFIIKGCPDPVKAMRESGNKFLDYLSYSMHEFDPVEYQKYLDSPEDADDNKWEDLADLCLPDVRNKTDYYSHYARWLCEPIGLEPVTIYNFDGQDLQDYVSLEEKDLPPIVHEWREFLRDLITRKIDSLPGKPDSYPESTLSTYFGKYSIQEEEPMSDSIRFYCISHLSREICRYDEVIDWIDLHIRKLPNIRDILRTEGIEFTVQDLPGAWVGSFEDDCYISDDIDESYEILDKLGNCDCKYVFCRTS